MGEMQFVLDEDFQHLGSSFLKKRTMKRVLLVPDRRGLRRQNIGQHRPLISIQIRPPSPNVDDYFDGDDDGPSKIKFQCTL